MKGHRLCNPVARKVIVNRDVFFNEPRLLKKGKNFESPRIDKRKSPVTDVVEKLDHYVTNDLSITHHEARTTKHHEQEPQKQVIVDEPIVTILNDRIQSETSTRRLHYANRAPERFDV